jgi:hypothetical protein
MQRCALRLACVVDQDRDRTGALDRYCESGSNGLGIGDIRHVGRNARTKCPCRFRERRAIPPQQRDHGTVPQQRFRDGAPDAACAARDDGVPTGERTLWIMHGDEPPRQISDRPRQLGCALDISFEL